jgi:hypothetical protein
MQPATNTQSGIDNELRLGMFIARRIDDALSWGEGAILPQSSFTSDDDQRALLEAVLANIEQVSEQELPFSACTDGRLPVQLVSGESVPVREQMVGADIVSAFFVAETLGDHFYKDVSAPVVQRVADVAAFLKENGLEPSSHLACGAGAGYAVVVGNLMRFAKNPAFVKRVQTLLPAGTYDDSLFTTVADNSKARLDSDAYHGLSVEVFIDAAKQVSGDHAVAELQDDGRGVHGHVEEQIVRVRVPGYAINETKVAAATSGREVFGVNDNRLEKIARLFGRGNDADYRTALIALEAFADAAHGTLAKDLPTYIVEKA